MCIRAQVAAGDSAQTRAQVAAGDSAQTRAQVAAGGSAIGHPHPPASRDPSNLADVVRGFTAADWREVITGLALIAPTIASAAALILMLEPARP